MISFCQDLSISYEYHIYENKTIKKIRHARNASNLSEQIFVKPKKLSLVSNKTSQLKPTHNFKGIKLTETNKIDKYITLSPKNKAEHRRTFSNNIPRKMIQNSEPKSNQNKFVQKQKGFLQLHETKQIEMHQKPFSQRVYFSKPRQIYRMNPENNGSSMLGQEASLSSQSYIQSANHLSQSQSPLKSLSVEQSQTLKINQSIQRLDQSLQTRKCNYDHYNHITQNRSHANSIASYPTIIKLGPVNMESSFVQDDQTSMQKGFELNKKSISLAPKQTLFKNNFKEIYPKNPQYLTSEPNNKNPYHLPYSQQNLSYNIIIPQKTLNISNLKNQKSILFDTASILSKSINDGEFDDESLSVVEQRNFFFEKQEDPNNAFKKSIQKFIFFEQGYSSLSGKWILFRNVEEKQNRKIYSIKEFEYEQQKDYLNEYDVYLSLKGQNSHQNAVRQINGMGQGVFLQLFNGLSNKQQKKFHLVKQSFECMLNDYIEEIKRENTLEKERLGIFEGQKNMLQLRIQKIFEFFISRNIWIRQRQHLQAEDFVICQDSNSHRVVKFHSLYKLEKSSNMWKEQENQSFKNRMKENRRKISQFCSKVRSGCYSNE